MKRDDTWSRTVEKATHAMDHFKQRKVTRNKLAQQVTVATGVPTSAENLEDLKRLIPRRSVRCNGKLSPDIETRCNALVRLHYEDILKEMSCYPEFNTEFGVVNTFSHRPVQVGNQNVVNRVNCVRADCGRDLEYITWASTKDNVPVQVIGERAEAVLYRYGSRLRAAVDLQVKRFRAEQLRFVVANIHVVLDIPRFDAGTLDRALMLSTCKHVLHGWRTIERNHMPEEDAAGIIDALKVDVGYTVGRLGILLHNFGYFKKGLVLLRRGLTDCLASNADYCAPFVEHASANLMLLSDRQLEQCQDINQRLSLVKKVVGSLERVPPKYLKRPISSLTDDSCPMVPRLLDAIRQMMPDRWTTLLTRLPSLSACIIPYIVTALALMSNVALAVAGWTELGMP